MRTAIIFRSADDVLSVYGDWLGTALVSSCDLEWAGRPTSLTLKLNDTRVPSFFFFFFFSVPALRKSKINTYCRPCSISVWFDLLQIPCTQCIESVFFFFFGVKYRPPTELQAAKPTETCWRSAQCAARRPHNTSANQWSKVNKGRAGPGYIVCEQYSLSLSSVALAINEPSVSRSRRPPNEGDSKG